ncbi:hypothetical protein [Pantoea trifolii]|uniref:hypothetical protein n=1 Tax=Candidatus Pantoea symbiotica TaxID=1884370 RepID=UPI00077BCE6E|nr:hypothetical protein [Pantoea rodasii]
MSFQHDGKGYVIIGEAALSIALGQRVVSVHSLIDELEYMANAGGSNARLSDISEATNWLKSFEEPDRAVRNVPYLQTLAGLNDETI